MIRFLFERVEPFENGVIGRLLIFKMRGSQNENRVGGLKTTVNG